MGKTKNRSSSSSSSGGSSEIERKKLRKLKKKLKKEQKKAKKDLKRKIKDEKKKSKSERNTRKKPINSESDSEHNMTTDIPLELMEKSKKMAPMTKEEWDQRQSIIRKVLDEETGRYRLIKGDGEVLEEIVSKERHRQINRLATKSDGDFFQTQTIDKKH